MGREYEIGSLKHTDPPDLRDVIEMIPALVVCALPDGSIDSVNRAWNEYTSCSGQQLSGSAWRTTIHPDDLVSFSGNLSFTLSAGKPFMSEVRVRRLDCEYRWFLVKTNFAVLRSQTSKPSLHCLITFVDIHERKLAQIKMQQSDARYRILVETASDAVVSFDESGIVQFANPSTMRIFGYDPIELIGKPLSVLVPEMMGRRGNWEGMEAIGLRKNGEQFPIEISLGELIKDGTRLFTGIIRDVSEKKRAEEERERLRQELAHITHLNRVSTLGELTASLAHEIKQPIGAAVVNAEACVRFIDCDQPDMAEAREAAVEMTKDARRAADIIERVRSLFRKGPSQRDLVDVNEVIREMAAMLSNEASRYSVTIRTDLTEGLPKVTADRVQLQQVLMNLVTNGIDAMRDTTGELSINSQLAEDGQLLITITDSGVGLPADDIDKIFDAFFTTKAQGTGLGLAITRSIVESHGGRVWATANSERGAKFHFTLE